MQIPTLIEAALKRMFDVLDVQVPRAMHHGGVFLALPRSELFAGLRAVWRRGQNICGAIGNPHSGAGKRNLHHVLGEIAHGIGHGLVRGGDAATGGVIVRAEMRRGASAGGGV